MPATESTWRNLKTVHVVFGVSAVAMLVATVWMLAADHNRQWKDYQRQFRDIETWTNAARIDEQQTAGYVEQQVKLEQALEDVQAAALGEKRQLFDKFIAEATKETKASDDQQLAADRQAAEKIAADVNTLEGYTDAKQRKALRMDLYQRLADFVSRVKFREDNLAQNLKFRKAALDQKMAKFSLAVGEGAPADETAELQIEVDQVRKDVDDLTQLKDAVKTHREALESIFKQITDEQDKVQGDLNKHKQQVAQLRKAFDQRRPGFGRSLLEAPVLDAFNSPLKIDPIWLPDLTLNNNFKEVARFDHCATCHQAIDKAAGSEPAYPRVHTITVSLDTPKEKPKPQKDEKGAEQPVSFEQLYGFQLADSGLLKARDVTISAVFPKTPAADAGLMMGDVIEQVSDAKIIDVDWARTNMLDNVQWGHPLELTIRRGMPHPYATHPRLDLFVGDASPHPKGTFGCTICHQGQGSATSFEFASHTPASPQQADEWAHEYGWFNNHHWIFPMFPRQFMEAGCLKCHHEVVDLEPSPQHPDPPAPTLLKGYEIIRNYGCFGCHEINGFNGPNKRVGPDLRAEPSFFAAAAQLRIDPGFSNLPRDIKEQVDQLRDHPENDAARHRVFEFLQADAKAEKPVLSAPSQKLDAVLKDVETQGVFRKVGPSLRYLKSKDGFEFLFSWIRNPRDFRPSTKMPRFFGLWDHLVPTEKTEQGEVVKDADGNVAYEESPGLVESKRFEPVEVRAIASYLLEVSQPFDYLGPNGGSQGSAERGKKAFQLRCIACHQHVDFPNATATQGPNLSRVGAKLGLKPFGAQWLYSWIKNPSHYHARTVMPNTLLTPVTGADGSVTDPIADITAFLMQSTEGWKPTDVPTAWPKLGDFQVLDEKALASLSSDQRKGYDAKLKIYDEQKPLYELALLYLKEKVPAERAAQYLREGAPERASGIKGDEAILVRDGPIDRDKQTERVLKYVGRRSISKYGCSGCHDIPGFEDAKPIGTALADWGRKDPARLAFEQIGEFVTHHAWPKGEKQGDAAAYQGSTSEGAHGAHGSAATHGNAAPDNLEQALIDLGPTQGWLMDKLLGHEREGFIWQKLRAPRSFDFRKTENKGYNERLRMPQFPFKQDEIEAVMTFVLGLVSEPPAAQYLATYSNRPRERAIIAGTKMIEQFNCTGCHQLDFQRWDIEFRPGDLGSASEPKDYPFELPHFTPDEIGASQKQDRRGQLRTQLYGQPLWNAKGEPVRSDENEEGDPFPGGAFGTRFVLWRDTLIDGKPWLVGAKNPLVPENRVANRFAGRGGDLPQWIYSTVVADELKVNPNAKAEEAWGWMPPPLIGEGKKVQTRWLHEFLLDPYPIRPAVVLRMPKFNMSSTEASQLVDFFAARDDAVAPYEFDARTSGDYLESAELQHPKRLFDALKIVTNENYCVKCHLVGDFVPPGSDRAKAPQLDRISERMRPDFTERWVGNPKRILPYTGMPVNIPFDKPVDQKIFAGDSPQQLGGVVDLLMNWDRFAKAQFTLKSMVKPAAPAAGASSPTGANERPARALDASSSTTTFTYGGSP